MVAVPRIKHCFSCVAWNGSSLMEWRLGVVGFPGRVGIQGLEIDRASKGAVFLCTSDHPVTPGDGFAHGDWFQQAHVTIEAGLHFLLPMEWDWNGGVVGNRCGVGVDHEAQGGSVHQG